MKTNYFILALAISLTILVLGMGYYYLIYEPVPVDDLAEEFCECAQSKGIINAQKVESQSNFVYSSGLDSCFLDAFSAYGEGLTDTEKEVYLKGLQEAIYKKCRDRLNPLFEYAEIYKETKKSGHSERFIRRPRAY